MKPPITWAAGVTTAPRPITTLEGTLASLEQAGFHPVRVVPDVDKCGAWRTWLRAVKELLAADPKADALLVCQDDAVFCRGLRDYLERSLWPADDVALCSPYCPGVYRSRRAGWHREDRGWNLAGALCWAIPRSAAEAMLGGLDAVRAHKQIDARLGRWAQRTGRSVWYHTPSLAQHVASTNSALGHNADNSLRRASDFVGEKHTPPPTTGPPAPDGDSLQEGPDTTNTRP